MKLSNLQGSQINTILLLKQLTENYQLLLMTDKGILTVCNISVNNIKINRCSSEKSSIPTELKERKRKREMILTKDRILGMIEDLVSNFLYYDRKNDEDAPVGSIEETIEANIVTIEELVEKFKEELCVS